MELPSAFFFSSFSGLMQLPAHPPSPSLPLHLPRFSSLSTFLRTSYIFEKDRALSLSQYRLSASFQAGLLSDAALYNFLLTFFRQFLCKALSDFYHLQPQFSSFTQSDSGSSLLFSQSSPLLMRYSLEPILRSFGFTAPFGLLGYCLVRALAKSLLCSMGR